jgi:hypothetical protein
MGAGCEGKFKTVLQRIISVVCLHTFSIQIETSTSHDDELWRFFLSVKPAWELTFSRIPLPLMIVRTLLRQGERERTLSEWFLITYIKISKRRKSHATCARGTMIYDGLISSASQSLAIKVGRASRWRISLIESTMCAAKERVLASFWGFNAILSIFGLVQLKPLKNIIPLILTRVQLIFFACAFSWFLLQNPRVTGVFNNDEIVGYCQFIDKCGMTAGIVLLFIESIVFKKKQFKVFELLSEIDELLEKSLKLKVDYGKFARVTHGVFWLNLLTIFGVAPRLLEDNLTSLQGIVYFIFHALTTILHTFYESYYSAIILHNLMRFKMVKSFLNSSYSDTHKEILNEIFMKSHRMVNVINDEFGVFMLLTTVKHFIRVTTRFYMVFHLMNFVKEEEFFLSGKIYFFHVMLHIIWTHFSVVYFLLLIETIFVLLVSLSSGFCTLQLIESKRIFINRVLDQEPQNYSEDNELMSLKITQLDSTFSAFGCFDVDFGIIKIVK